MSESLIPPCFLPPTMQGFPLTLFSLTPLVLTATVTECWSPRSWTLCPTRACSRYITSTTLAAASDGDNGDEENWEDELDKLGKIGDNLLNLSKINEPTSPGSSLQPKLGINIGSQLTPLSEKEAAELRAAAMEVINDGVAEGIDSIEKMRKEMKLQIEKQRAQMELKSDLELQQEKTKLLSKIDKITADFLSKTKAYREETKLVATADRNSQGQGVELGVWGTIAGAAVLTTGGASVGLLGSVDAAKAAAEKQAKKLEDAEFSDLKIGNRPEEQETVPANANRVIIIADTAGDPMAKQLVPAFTTALKKSIPTLEDIAIYRPTDTVPLGGDNAVCAILFLSSLSDRSSIHKITDRLLRRTVMPGGALGTPPTQFVGISTLGTERTDKFPYSMQNLMGGKLEQRRQMEEALIATVQNRVTLPPLDYTICKFGELKDGPQNFCMMPGDVLDGTTSPLTATQVLLQAVAFQPYARNATLCAVGTMPSSTDPEAMEALWDDTFLRLDGPELERWTSTDLGSPEVYDRLNEYLNEWANNFALNPRGLTTPIRVEPSRMKKNRLTIGVRERTGLRLLFLPTATGKNYMNKEEEREREMAGGATLMRSKMAKEGGIEVVVEITSEDRLRIRAKRCNYADGVPLKFLSEETILKRLEKAIDVWCREARI